MKFFLFALILFFLFPFSICAQYFKVKGIVTDMEDNPIENIIVFPQNMYFEIELGGRSNEQGIFTTIMPKDSTLIIEHISYEPTSITLQELEKKHYHIRLNERIEIFDKLIINCNDYSFETSTEEIMISNQEKRPTDSIFQKDYNLGAVQLDSFKLSDEEHLIQIHIYDAMFPGGNANLMKFIYEKLHPLIPLIKDKSNPQHIEVSFTINPLGYCKDVALIQKTYTFIDDKVIEAFESMPRWKPAIQRGKSVFSKYIFPLSFTPDCE